MSEVRTEMRRTILGLGLLGLAWTALSPLGPGASFLSTPTRAATWATTAFTTTAWAGEEQRAHHHALDLEQYIARLEDPEREGWQKPDEVIQALAIKKGEVVADIGAGSGYFSVRLARAVGPEGRVLALDPDERLLDYLRRRLAEGNVQNVTARTVPRDDPELPEGSVDLAFLCNVYHHIDGRPDYLRRLRRALKPTGRLVIVDFYKKTTPVGPPLGMRVDADTARRELAEGGFRVEDGPAFLPYQYVLVARPEAGSQRP